MDTCRCPLDASHQKKQSLKKGNSHHRAFLQDHSNAKNCVQAMQVVLGKEMEHDSTQLRSAVQRCCQRDPALVTVQQKENTTTRVRKWQQLKSLLKWSQDSVTPRGCKMSFIMAFFPGSIRTRSGHIGGKLSEATHVSPKVPQVPANFEHRLSSPHHHMNLPASFEQAFRALHVQPAPPQNLPKTQEQAIAVAQYCMQHHLPQAKVIDSARMYQEPACRKTEDTGLCVGAQLENLLMCDSRLNHC